MTIGEKIKMLREKSGLTQKQLAEQLFLKQNAISAYEKGVNQPPLEIVRLLAATFNVTSDYLLDIDRSTKVSALERTFQSILDEVIYEESYEYIRNGDVSEETAELLKLMIKKDFNLLEDIYKK
ncbi:helix-turn-helix domain-containing protein [Carnobacterium gallinarum]|uniref:helix-turn-helix domain-containing protein n=1 Tax=Carnobacterium gallinarum TaxID=2749 RepID=UPI000554C33E|nr:helix-turn-helix transcriptional regulator [Carnobacterium gallinarum]